MRRATAQGAPSSGVVRQDDAFERYTVGDGACCRGVELALETMREGETAFFHVRVRHLTPTTAYPEEVRITLRRVHPDVVLARGVEGECDASSVASVVKTRERWGAAKTEGSTAYLAAVAAKTLRRDARDIGRVVARRGWRARLAVEPAENEGEGEKKAAASSHESVSAAVVDVVVGAGRAAEALELAVALSSPGERFRVTFATHAYGRADTDADAESDADAEAADAAAATAKSTTATTAKSTPTTTITAEVLSLDPPEGDDDVEGMSLEARMRRAEAEKERGVALYRAGRFRAAVRAYDACVDALVAPFAPRAFVPDVVDEGDETAEGAAAVASSPFGAAAVASSPSASSLPTPSSPGPSARAASASAEAAGVTGRRPNPWRGAQDDCALLMNAALLNAALAASKRGDDASCERYCARVLDRDPGGDPRNVKALFRRGRARVALGRWDDAEDDFARAEKIDPTVARDVAAERRKARAARAEAAEGLKRGFRRAFGGGAKSSADGCTSPRAIWTYVSDAEALPGPGRRAPSDPPASSDEGLEGLTDPHDPRAVAEYAADLAIRMEEQFETSLADAGFPFELYSDAERAPAGEAFPSAGRDTTMFPDYEAIEAELKEEAQMEEARRRLGEGLARGEATRRAARTTHPWDRDGSKAKAEAEEAARAEAETAAARDRDAEAAARAERKREKRTVATADDVPVD